ncbi:MAG: hypothetical protein NTY02_16475 [Acidobacteria bacterium]|nr:hypothetical protein [Acidobacteriota bacterium]
MRTAAFLLAMLIAAALPLHAAPPGAPAAAGGATVRSRIDNSTVPAGADGILRAAISREAGRLAGERRDFKGFKRAFSGQASGGAHRSWMSRHAVLVGTIVGAVGGAAIVGAAVDPEASFIGFFGGGAAGALVGFAATR